MSPDIDPLVSEAGIHFGNPKCEGVATVPLLPERLALLDRRTDRDRLSVSPDLHLQRPADRCLRNQAPKLHPADHGDPGIFIDHVAILEACPRGGRIGRDFVDQDALLAGKLQSADVVGRHILDHDSQIGLRGTNDSDVTDLRNGRRLETDCRHGQRQQQGYQESVHLRFSLRYYTS